MRFYQANRIEFLLLSVFLLLFSVGAKSQTAQFKNIFSFNHGGLVTSTGFSPDSRLLASSGTDGNIHLWDTVTGKPLKVLRGHQSEVNIVIFSPDGRLIVSGGYDKRLIVWNTKTRKILHKISLSAWSLALAFAPDGNLVAGFQDGSIKVIDVKTGKSIREFKADYPIWDLIFSPGKEQFMTAGPITVWNYKTGEKIRTLQTPGGITDLAVTPDGKQIMSAHFRLGIRFWNMETGKQDGVLRTVLERSVAGVSGSESMELEMPLASMALSPDGNYLLAGDAYKTIYIWDFRSRRLLQKIEDNSEAVNSLSFSPNGKLFASGSLDGSIRLWSF